MLCCQETCVANCECFVPLSHVYRALSVVTVQNLDDVPTVSVLEQHQYTYNRFSLLPARHYLGDTKVSTLHIPMGGKLKRHNNMYFSISALMERVMSRYAIRNPFLLNKTCLKQIYETYI